MSEATCTNCGSGIYKIEEASTEYHFPGDSGYGLPKVTEYSCGRVHVDDRVHGGDIEVFASEACDLILSLREELAAARDANQILVKCIQDLRFARDAERDRIADWADSRALVWKREGTGLMEGGQSMDYYWFSGLAQSIRNNEHRSDQ